MSIKDQTLTFAAICQVAHLVQKFSRTGDINQDDLAVLLSSIVITSPTSTLEVYGDDTGNLAAGLKLLMTHLGDNSKKKDPEFTRYIVAILSLERKLTRNPKKLAELGKRIEQAKRQISHYAIDSETLLASFASIYSDIVSPLGTKIQVAGNPEILKQTASQHKIRALLLAGVRAAVLWRQVGGQRRKILFARSKILECAQQLIHQI